MQGPATSAAVTAQRAGMVRSPLLGEEAHCIGLSVLSGLLRNEILDYKDDKPHVEPEA